MFITFEGVEGAGKTTQIKLLAERLNAGGKRPVLVTREPGEGPLGVELRHLVLNPPAEITVDERAELLIMLADRAQHVAQIMRPHLEAGGIVICDRYIDSSVAYQGHGRGLDIAVIDELNGFATDGLIPDLTVVLDLDPRIGLARQSERNRMEDETLPFHRRVRNGFLSVASQNPQRFAVLDAGRPADTIHAQIWALVTERLGA